MRDINEKRAVIYLAGGCFWGLEKLMRSIPGILDAVSGYANPSVSFCGLSMPKTRPVLDAHTGFFDRLIYARP